jgi:hypothetical protein
MTRRPAGLFLLAAACGSATESTPPDGSSITVAISGLAYPAETWLGQADTKLSYVVSNTGTARWSFGVTASLRKPDESTVVDLPLRAVTLSAGQARTVSWDLPPWRPAGRWDVRVNVWQETSEPIHTRLADSGWLLDVISTRFWVRYHANTPAISRADADTRLAQAQGLLRGANGVGDVACDVRLAQFGEPASFATGDGIIDNQSDFDAVLAVPGSIKMVNQINWCDGIAAGIIGCSPIPGFSFVVREMSSTTRDRELWAHEYGHTAGLNHNPVAEYVMYAHYDPLASRYKVTLNECSAYRKGPA